MTLLEALDCLLDEEYISDFVYNVRDRAMQDKLPDGTYWEGRSWDHPRVKNYSKALKVLENLQADLRTKVDGR